MALNHEKSSLDRAIAESVELTAWRPEWPAMFAAERDRLQAASAEINAIEHIGSTAIEGLPAKPVIDILAGVASMEIARSLAGPLARAGYTTSAAYNAGLTDRQWFMRWANGHRTHHLHVVVTGGPVWQARLAFRDVLRQRPDLAAQYVQLKQLSAAAHPDDREAYTVAKTGFIEMVLAGVDGATTRGEKAADL
jgi:GrpB-like predicted nucleotidyltransferase (UPF0157 family)